MDAVARDRTLPLQGGLPMTPRPDGTVVEIACDESGFSGTNLLDSTTPVFTHASVDLAPDEAAELVVALRSRFRWSLTEFKSGELVRAPHGEAASDWLLEALDGRAHVLVVDKKYFLVTRIVDLFLAEPSYAAGTRLTSQQREAAVVLHRAGRVTEREWSDFLSAFVQLVRTKRRRVPDHRVVEQFLQARDSLAATGLGEDAEAVLAALSRSRVAGVTARLADDDRSIPPPLEPLLPALAETVLFWSGGRRRVLVVHDEQSALTADRLRRLQQVLTRTAVSPLAGLVTVDSRDDPRVQVADLLAGIARRSTEAYAPLRAFVSPTSLLA